jgi:hypothetical protein
MVTTRQRHSENLMVLGVTRAATISEAQEITGAYTDKLGFDAACATDPQPTWVCKTSDCPYCSSDLDLDPGLTEHGQLSGWCVS